MPPILARRLLAMPAFLIISLLVATAPASDVLVKARALTFDPPEVTIAPGDRVLFQAVEGFHTVTSGVGSVCSDAGALFDATIDALGGTPTYLHTFSKAGTFPYFCRPHEGAGMLGVVQVRGLIFNGTPQPGQSVSFSVANLPPSDIGGRALVLLSLAGTSPGISLGPCLPEVAVAFDSLTQLGLALSPVLTTGPINLGGSASTPVTTFPQVLPNVTVFAAAVVLRSGAFGSVLPPLSFVTQ